MREGRRDGEFRGRQDGSIEGRRDGERRGRDEGNTAGMNAGRTAGLSTDQSDAVSRGGRDGEAAGIEQGESNGKSRCYSEGYTPAYEASFSEAKKLGLSDTASYNQGYENGKAKAATIEESKGRKAGYQNGFAMREAEIVNSFPAPMQTTIAATETKGISRDVSSVKLPIKMARGGYSTPQERRAYKEAYERAHNEAFRESYRHAKEMEYRREYRYAYDAAYNSNYQAGYQTGFSEGKEAAYQAAYRTEYNTRYNYAYYDYSSREYADSRSRGQQEGLVNGKENGFKAGCEEAFDTAYKKGYQDAAAVVYPKAFQAGKMAGIAAAEKYYAENAVLKVGDVTLSDENGNGKFEAAENIIMKVSVRNLGFKTSDKISISAASGKKDIVISPNLVAGPVGQRADLSFEVKLGTILDTVASDQDTVAIDFIENGVSDVLSHQEKSFVRYNVATIGVVTEDRAPVTEHAALIFTAKLAKLHIGDKVIIREKGAVFYKVRKPMFTPGDWSKGYMKISDLVLQ